MKRNGSGKIRVGVIGVGNCASSLVQGVQFYRDATEDQFVPGLMHVNIGGYHVRDIECSDPRKVGREIEMVAEITCPNGKTNLGPRDGWVGGTR